MERRDYIKTVGGIGTASVLGGLGIATLTGTAGASTSINFTANGVNREFVDGEVTAVSVLIEDGELTWDGFEHEATDVDVTLSAKGPEGSWSDLETKNIGLAGNQRKEGSTTFNLGPVDLTGEESPYSDSDFSVDGDGESGTTDVEIRVTAEFNTTGSSSPSGHGQDTLSVGVQNIESDVGVDAETTSPVSYAGEIYDKNDAETAGTPYLRLYYTSQEVVVEMDLSEYVSQISDGNPYLNGAVGLDLDEDGIGDFQLGWLEGDQVNGSTTWAVKEGDSSGWGSWQDASSHALVTDTSEENGVVRFTLDRDEFGQAAGDTFRTGFFASAGGEEEYAVVSNDNVEFWSSAQSYTSSENFIRTEAE